MRKVEQRIIAALEAGRSAKLSRHDRVKPDGRVYLFGNLIAYWNKARQVLHLGTCGGAWQTVTTKSRINALARHFHVPGLIQRDFVWYWTDGKRYDDIRSFDLTPPPDLNF